MQEEFEKTKVLITVMTYPHPSKGYKELVCTAGITDKNEWVRLYPVDYRYRPRNQQFHKYQWIEVELSPRGKGNDNRKESRKPKLDSIKILGEPLPSDDAWRARREIISKMPVHTVNELKEQNSTNKTSLGIVKPSKVLDLKIEEADSEWKPEWQMLFDQLTLFGPPQKALAKLPYKFSYVFECSDSEKPHNAMIEDWELGMLFLNERERLGNDEKAAESVKKKFFGQLCDGSRDTHFFMGTKFPYNVWLVLGVFWPPAEYQLKLF